MKKNTLFIALFFTVATIISFTSCQDEIFNEIRDEIKLEDSTISGHINSIVRFDDYVVTQNGNIYYKSKDSIQSDWTKDTNWSGKAAQLASDSSNLYALCTNWGEDVDEGEWTRESTTILYKNSISGTWNTIETVSGNTTVVLFGTNSFNSDNRKAYVRIGSEVYKLSGGTKTALTTNTTNASTTPTASTLSCVYFDGHTYFFNSLASTTNEKSSAATCMYYASDDTIYYSTNGTDWTYVDVGSDEIYSMSYTSDYLVLGTDSGLQESALTGNVPSSANDDFSNTSSTLSSYYEVWAVLATKPGSTLTENTIYAAIDYSGSSSSTSAVFDNIGLWSYYQSRGKWNRE